MPGKVTDSGTRSAARVGWCLAGLAAALVALVVASLCIGSLAIPAEHLLPVLTGQERDSAFAEVVWVIRMPRLVAAALLGAALALAGLLLQTLFNNPIAGPFVLGISSGAKLAVAILMVCVVGATGTMSSWMSVAAAFAGSLAALAFVLGVARRMRSPATLIVCGVMIGYVCSAATDFLVTFASDANIANLRNWSLGSFSGIKASELVPIACVVVAASAGSLALAKPMAAYQLGERYAASAGVNVRAFRIACIALSSLLAACVTAFAGPISFVGVAVPHIARRLLGSSRPLYTLPASFLAGADFCLLADLVARTVLAPTELSVSTMTAVLGAPVVLWVLLGRSSGGEAA